MDGKSLQQLLFDLKTFSLQPQNQRCADCNEDGDVMKRGWISTNLGVFVCINCAGIHRSLGTHISQILSLELDVFDNIEVIEHVLKIGNKIANECWLSCNPALKNLNLADIKKENNMKNYIEAKYTGQDFKRSIPDTRSGNSKRKALIMTGPSRIAAGILRIQLIKGVDLKPVDYNGQADPYVHFFVAGKQKLVKSKILKRTLNPEWRQTLMMNIEEGVGMITVECWDYNKFTSDVLLGRTKVELTYFLDESEHFMVLKFEKGELHINFQFTRL